jgi:hypothetical protein
LPEYKITDAKNEQQGRKIYSSLVLFFNGLDVIIYYFNIFLTSSTLLYLLEQNGDLMQLLLIF